MTTTQIALAIYIVSLVICWLQFRSDIKNGVNDPHIGFIILTLVPAINSIVAFVILLIHIVSNGNTIIKAFFCIGSDD